MPSSESDTTTTRPGRLDLTGLPTLSAPGPDSNYLDWEWKLGLYIDDLDLGHTLRTVAVTERLDSWDRDNIRVSSIISRTINAANNEYARPCGRDAMAMWTALKHAHDNSHTVDDLIKFCASIKKGGSKGIEEYDAYIIFRTKFKDILEFLKSSRRIGSGDNQLVAKHYFDAFSPAIQEEIKTALLVGDRLIKKGRFMVLPDFDVFEKVIDRVMAVNAACKNLRSK